MLGLAEPNREKQETTRLTPITKRQHTRPIPLLRASSLLRALFFETNLISLLPRRVVFEAKVMMTRRIRYLLWSTTTFVFGYRELQQALLAYGTVQSSIALFQLGMLTTTGRRCCLPNDNVLPKV